MSCPSKDESSDEVMKENKIHQTYQVETLDEWSPTNQCVSVDTAILNDRGKSNVTDQTQSVDSNVGRNTTLNALEQMKLLDFFITGEILMKAVK